MRTHVARIPGARVLRFVVVVVAATASWGAYGVSYEIDWSKCKQPDLGSAAFIAKADKQYDRLVAEAAKALPARHIAVQLNRYYPTAVKQRRDLIAGSYVPPGKRPASGCAMTDAKYEEVLALRDGVYKLLCRSEYSIGKTSASRAANDAQIHVFTELYEALKKTGANMAASTDPTTPPGGAAACYRGIDDGKNDAPPKDAEVAGFETHMGACDGLARLISALPDELKKKAKEKGICTKEGG